MRKSALAVFEKLSSPLLLVLRESGLPFVESGLPFMEIGVVPFALVGIIPWLCPALDRDIDSFSTGVCSAGQVESTSVGATFHV